MIAFYRSGAWFLAAALLAASSVRAQPSLPPSPPPAPPPTETTSKPATVNVSAPSPAPTTTVVNVGKAIEEACKGCTDKNECSSVAQSYCDTIKKEKAAGAAPSDDCEDPTSACYASYWRRRGIDPDELLKGKNPNKHDLELALARAEQTSAGPELLLVAIGGLQSFLEERAKAEALDYAIEQLEGRLCNDRYRTYLAATCKLLEGSDVNLDQATLVRLQKAVVKDLARLPKSLIRSLPPSE
ncbi:MAG TPA: hypothetical protein VF103_09315, partial [Polyangiaceae bacterium]